MMGLLDIARQIDPGATEPYLRAHGWELVRQGHLGNRWSTEVDDKRRNIAVPLRRVDPEDAARMLAAVLEVLSEVERRDPVAIARDVAAALFDVVEFCLVAETLTRGEMPLRSAPELTRGALDAMQAAARTAVSPRAHFASGNLPGEVRRFVDDAVLAGTDKGSVILRVRPPALCEPVQPQLEDMPQLEGFSRRAVIRLLGGTRAAKAATHMDFTAVDQDMLDQEIDRGLSANLCDALLGLSGVASGLDARVAVRVRWALTQPVAVPSEDVRIDHGELGQLETVAELLKQIQPQPDRTVEGHVVQVRRLPGEPEGTVLISADLEDRVRQVRMRLAPEDYQIAVEAHAARGQIRATGTLERSGTIRELVDLSQVRRV